MFPAVTFAGRGVACTCGLRCASRSSGSAAPGRSGVWRDGEMAHAGGRSAVRCALCVECFVCTLSAAHIVIFKSHQGPPETRERRVQRVRDCCPGPPPAPRAPRPPTSHARPRDERRTAAREQCEFFALRAGTDFRATAFTSRHPAAQSTEVTSVVRREQHRTQKQPRG